MKTISFNRTPRNIFSLIAVIGGLSALYFYRRRGGTYNDLYKSISRLGGSARDYLRSTASPDSTMKYAGVEGRAVNV